MYVYVCSCKKNNKNKNRNHIASSSRDKFHSKRRERESPCMYAVSLEPLSSLLLLGCCFFYPLLGGSLQDPILPLLHELQSVCILDSRTSIN